jgi:hypothetical protein
MKHLKRFEEKDPEVLGFEDQPMGFDGGKEIIKDKITELDELYQRFWGLYPNIRKPISKHMSFLKRMLEEINSLTDVEQDEFLGDEDFRDEGVYDSVEAIRMAADRLVRHRQEEQRRRLEGEDEEPDEI